MHRHLFRETTLTHLAVALGVVLLSGTLVLGPLGSISQPETPPTTEIAEVAEVAEIAEIAEVAEPTLEAIPLAMDAETILSGSWRDEMTLSSRGGRELKEDGLSSADGRAAPLLASTPSPTSPSTLSPTSEPAERRAQSILSLASPVALPDSMPPPSDTSTPIPTTAPSPTPPPSDTSTPIPTTAPSPTAAPPPTATAVPTVAPVAKTGFRVGLQVGHWKCAELPAELASLRRSTGAAGQGWRESDVNMEVATRAAELLRAAGVQVDLLPATVPVAYKADAFVSIHGDGNSNTTLSGYKLARARWSQIPTKEDALLKAISLEYAAATGFREHPATITEAMRQYYAFNYRALQHAVAPTTPSVILELGFLTTPRDRQFLLQNPDKAAEGVARGVLRFLEGR